VILLDLQKPALHILLHNCPWSDRLSSCKGYIYQTNGAWDVRYRVDGKQVSRKLADYNDQYRTKRSVRPLADEIIDPLNQGLQVNGPMTLQPIPFPVQYTM
jgi:hypothetical protein